MRLSAVLCLVTLFFGGCAGKAIVYSLAESEIQKPAQPIPVRLMVATFKDARSEEEKTGSGKAKGLVATQDRFFQNVPVGITKAVVEHLRKTELFQEIRPAAFSSDEVRSERLLWSGNDADVILVGSVDHFSGIIHRSDAMMAGMAGAAGAAGG
jgi:hypothetical protein